MYGKPARYEEILNTIEETEFEDLSEVKAHFNAPIKMDMILKASILCDMPIVVLSDWFQDKTIGMSFEPKLDQSGLKSPIYFLISGSTNTGNRMLLHKSQIYAATYYQKMGLTVRKFKPLPPDLTK